MRNWIKGAALGLAALMTPLMAPLMTRSASAQELPTVSIGYFPDIWSGGTIAIAQEKGYFEEAGIQVDAQRFTSGAPAIAALGSGNLNISYVGLGPMPQIMRGVAKIVGFDNVTYSDQVLVQADSGIEDIGGLEDRTVLAPRSSGSQILLYLALERAGLSPDDIEELGGSPATIVSAMISKQAEAAALWSPFNAEIADKAGTRTLVSGRDFYPDYVWPGMWVANPDFVEEEEELLKRALWALQKATDWRAENREEAARIAAEAYDLSETSVALAIENTEYFTAEDIANAFSDGTVDRWMAGVNEQLQLIGNLDEPIAPENFVVSAPYVDVQQNGLPGGASQ